MVDLNFNVELLEKHKDYLNKYVPDDIYWGIGIENECYLEFEYHREVNREFMLNNAQRERYCINYYKNYKDGIYFQALNRILKDSDYTLPLLMNSHSLQKVDLNNHHMTLYGKGGDKPNPFFSGETLYQLISKKDDYFIKECGHKFIFDGDTIEFPTQNFYKTTIHDSIIELSTNKHTFITKLNKIFDENNIYKQFGKIDICKKNYPFAIFISNLDGYTIFNNMTYHFNFTMPTKLDEVGEILNKEQFILEHQNAIRLFQWLSPLFMIKYGSYDYLSKDNFVNLTKSSQRCALSRYIGIGTYNTDKMLKGKILQMNWKDHPMAENPMWWFNRYYQISDYVKLDKIGLDINFHKHKNHGIEFRIFDYFDEKYLEEVLQFIVFILDHSYEKKVKNPLYDLDWNDFVFNSILYGKDTLLSRNLIDILENITDTKLPSNNPIAVFDTIYNSFFNKYYENGRCSGLMIKKRSKINMVKKKQEKETQTEIPTGFFKKVLKLK